MEMNRSAGNGPGEEVALLLRESEPRLRVVGARLAAKLDMAFLREDLQRLAMDQAAEVRENSGPETAANTGICLVCQATYLLDRLLKQLERDFIEKGGITERMTRARLRYRNVHGD